MLTPFKQHRNRDTKEELNILLQKGFSRIYLPASGEVGETLRIEDLLEMDDKELKKKLPAPGASILVDRLVVKAFDEDDRHRIADSVGTAFYEGEGEMQLEVNGTRRLPFSNRFELDGINFEEPVPNLFSFNNPFGACPTCEGFSRVLGIDADLVIPDRRLSVYEGAVAPWKGEKLVWWKDQFVKAAKKFDFPIHKPVIDLTKQQYKALWEGNEHVQGINDFFAEVERNLYKVQYRVLLSRYRGRTECPDCKGYRLRKEALYVRIGDKHIGELCEIPVKDLSAWFDHLVLEPHEQQIAKRILIEIRHRLSTLMDVGLGYLTLARLANSLKWRRKPAYPADTQPRQQPDQLLYILDEPSIGLHSRGYRKADTRTERTARSWKYGSRSRTRRDDDAGGGLYYRYGPSGQPSGRRGRRGRGLRPADRQRG
ncbi:hypothetical protein ACQ86N_39590 [Puia sp. P3]|uniref:hypothetical protein n=1 Tax=Puia sp. P3 TaxID=3423952 RepID=UPI003D66A08F